MIPFLVGERLFLRALTTDDADGDYLTWFNDEAVCAQNAHHVYPYSREEAYDYIATVNADRAQLVLAIIADGNHIGNIALQDIHPQYHSANFAIVIGNKDYWHKGYGKEAARLIIAHGFNSLNLHRISCATFSNNVGMQALAESLGFKVEGYRRETAYKSGGYLDVIEYGLLQAEWKMK
jgi:RimJ/RimL family protein N-acetyltransferase